MYLINRLQKVLCFCNVAASLFDTSALLGVFMLSIIRLGPLIFPSTTYTNNCRCSSPQLTETLCFSQDHIRYLVTNRPSLIDSCTVTAVIATFLEFPEYHQY